MEDRRGGLWVAGLAAPGSGGGLLLYRYDPSNRSWDTLDEKRGYGGQGVRTMYEDRRGGVWLGTEQGLMRFDGQRFEDVGKLTGLGAEVVCAILEDREGRVWIGVDGGGLRCLDPNWTTFTTADGLANNAVTQLLELDGRLLAGTKEGLNRLRPGPPLSFERLSSTAVLSLRADRQRRLWVLGGSGLSVLDSDGRVVLTGLTQAVNNQLDVVGPQDILEDAHGDVWITFDAYGLGRIRQKDILVPPTGDRAGGSTWRWASS